MTRLWQTTVYNKSHERTGTYYFRHISDVERSVRETWCKEPGTIKQLSMADNSKVWVYRENNGVAVEAIQGEIVSSETWTRF